MELVKKPERVFGSKRQNRFLSQKYDGRESQEIVFRLKGIVYLRVFVHFSLAQKNKFVQLRWKKAPNNVGVNRTSKVVARSKWGEIVCPPLGGPLFFPFDLSHNTRTPTKRKRSPPGAFIGLSFLFLFPLSLRTLAPMISQRRRRRNSQLFFVFSLWQ